MHRRLKLLPATRRAERSAKSRMGSCATPRRPTSTAQIFPTWSATKRVFRWPGAEVGRWGGPCGPPRPAFRAD